jgi:hypothetical protein
MRHAGAAPARSTWKEGVLLLHQWRGMKWRLRPVSRRTLLGFSEALICLSYAAMVPPRGFAPRSAAYRAAALLLSYRGMKKWSPEEVTLPCLPDVGRRLCF